MRPVVVESPYAGDVERNLRYLRACLRDCIERGETPYASHGLLTQPGVLDDDVLEERVRGINAGFVMAQAVSKAGGLRVFYSDLGWSSGMQSAWADARYCAQETEVRLLGGEWAQ